MEESKLTARKTDRRTVMTKSMIKDALLELLQNTPYEKITVTALCKQSEITRATFYLHYKDIYDLRDQIEEEMMADFQKALSPLLETAQDVSPVKITTGIFQCLKDNADLCTVTLGDYGDKAFAYRLVNTGREKCLTAYSRFFAAATPKQIEFFYAFVSAGCIGLLQKWLAEGMATSAEEVAAMAEDIMM